MAPHESACPQGERGSDEKRNQFDKVTLKLLNLYLEKMWNPTTRMLDLSGMIKASGVHYPVVSLLFEVCVYARLYSFLNHFSMCLSCSLELAELSPNLNNYIFCSKLARSIADGKPWAQVCIVGVCST